MTMRHGLTDYQRRVMRQVRDSRGCLVAYESLPGGIGVAALLARPPFRPLAGRYAKLAGRGRRECQSPRAVADRCELVARAWEMRVRHGMTIRQIARAVDRSPSAVGRWLINIPAAGGDRLGRLEYEVWTLAQRSERGADSAERMTCLPNTMQPNAAAISMLQGARGVDA